MHSQKSYEFQELLLEIIDFVRRRDEMKCKIVKNCEYSERREGVIMDECAMSHPPDSAETQRETKRVEKTKEIVGER